MIVISARRMACTWRNYIQNSLELTNDRQSRMMAMEGLRGVAASLVFLQHFSVQWLLLNPSHDITWAIATELRKYGNLGVELFFVLSGFLIYGGLIRRRQAFLPFMRRRIQRIYPAFLVAFAITATLHVVTGSGKIPLEPLEALTYLIANLLLLPGLWPIVPLMSVAWSLSYEVFFYVTTALAVSKLHLDQWSRKTRVAMIIMLGMALTILGVIVEFGCISIGSDELHCIRVPIRMLPFFAGMLLAEAEAAHFKAAPALLALTMPVVAFLIDATTNLPGIINEWMHTVAFLFLCSACFRGENRAATVFAWTPLRWVGNMSYSFYLIHGLALLPGFALIATLGASASMPAIFWGTMPILYAGAAVASFILFVMIERPYSFRPQRAIAARSWRSADSSLRP